MNSLRIVDCLASDVIRVLEEERALENKPIALYAVFRSSREHGRFCGLCTTRDIAQHPDWIFADLVEHRPIVALPPDAVVSQALTLMEEQQTEAVAVLADRGDFLGAVTRTSILQGLLQESARMHALLEKDRQQLEAWSRRLAELYEASRTLLEVLSHSSLERDLLQTGIDALARLLQARYGALGLVDEDGRLVDFVYTGLSREEAARIGCLPQGKGLLGVVIRENTTIRLEDLTQDPRYAGFPPGHPMMKSLLAVPISHLEHVYGRIYLCDKRDGTPFSAEDETLALNYAHTLALALDHAREMEQIRQQQKELDYLAHFDTLTGLPNRALLIDRMQQALRVAKRHRQKVAVLFIDLDDFKHVNDSLGHATGDRLLTAVAQRLLGCVRAEDTLARLGGDEFVVVLPELRDLQDAAIVAQKILMALEAPFAVEGHELFSRASIGISLYPTDADSADALLANADVAMYHAKRLGKNNYQFFASEMARLAHKRLQLESRLCRALERGELVLHYQPQVELESRRIVGMEALLRWNNPELGWVLPGDFIPLAEEIGLIVEIGAFVLQTALSQAKAWQEAGFPIRMAVNLSARQFQQNGLVETVLASLRQNGLAPSVLELEITETVLLQDTGNVLDVLTRLSSEGVRFSMDDFGTGYSSLSYLKKFPIGVLKIDRSFVRDIPNDENDVAIVSAILAMASQLNLETVAEGIETAEQLETLRERGCRYGQGYFFSQPLSSAETTALLQRNLASPTTAETSTLPLLDGPATGRAVKVEKFTESSTSVRGS